MTTPKIDDAGCTSFNGMHRRRHARARMAASTPSLLARHLLSPWVNFKQRT
jgi:hypothetical protein